MHRNSGCILFVVCCLAYVAVGQVDPRKPNVRLVEAQAEFDAASKLKDAGGYPEALTRAGHALALREAVLGSTHPDVAGCLNLLGNLHRLQGELARAEPLLQRALALREQALGARHLDVAQSLNDLASLYLAQGLYSRAEPLLQRALVLREAALGKRHPQVADSLNDLGALYFAQGLYDQTESLFERALALRKQALGERHLGVAQSFNDLASLYLAQGKYKKAEDLFRKSLALHEESLGKSHPDVAQVLNNLAALYVAQGQYGQAERLFQRALDIYESAPAGSDPTRVADSLNNLASIYQTQGLYDRAEPLLQRALELRKQALGEGHPRVADSLNNLANLYLDQKSYGQAEPLFERAFGLYEATFGPSHPTTAQALHNLAALYRLQGLYGQAKPLLERALVLREQALGERHPDIAQSLNILADVYRLQGWYDRAEPLLERALALREQFLGESHPDVAISLRRLAQLRLAQHRLEQALPLLTRAFSLSEQRLRHEALDFSESRLSSFLHSLRAEEETLYALLRAHPQDVRVQRLALGATLLLKGRSVEETAQISRTLYQHLGPEDRDTFERLRGLRTRLADLSLAGPGALSSEDYQQRLKTLTEEGDSLEADLARRSAPLRALSALPSLADIVERVAASLPQDGALVEFIAYEDSPLVHPPGTPPASTPGPVRYLALVLFPDASIRVVDLGPAVPIDRAASGLRDALAHPNVSSLAPAQKLHQLVFQPLRPLLGSTRRLLLSPDGQLGLVPFDALRDGHAFLLDSFHFTYLTSGRELLPRPQDIAPSSSVFVLADPDFSATAPAPASTPRSAPTPVPPSGPLERFFSSWRGKLPGGSPAPLPGTRLEAQGIQHLLPQAQLFLGPEATKERLLLLPTPGILHVATHGFFLGEPPSTPGSRHRDVGESSGGDAFAAQQEPLLNSGLLLASTRAAAAGVSTPSVESSLVTALELAGLDLWGTQLVVLSACDTGRGEVQLGQGIYGLRRALVVAGAETVVMSLWKVRDDTTRLLMEAYYRNLLAGQGRASALREAMRLLRASHPHPYYWAPFIALGSDAPLHAINSPDSPTPEAPSASRK
ncbi:tetratricopeptide repeat protein [Cystobacter fuscus]|uniref:CHAT domain-containing tetratricopeptide repeat protein n=1 Tax=Cystobacter fuscus TaxID=43 RepID=UPI002B2A4CC8|nr:tetratricopeptide repeat protein [Cystobacter fuscus]